MISTGKIEKQAIPPRAHMNAQYISSILRSFVLLGFFLILTFGPIFYGAVMEWQVCILVCTSLLMLLFWRFAQAAGDNGNTVKLSDNKIFIFLYGLPIIFALLVFLQVLPLPIVLLKTLSLGKHTLNNLAGLKGNTIVSVAPHTTGLWLLRVIGYICVFVVASQALTNRRSIIYIIGIIVILGYMNALYGILQYLSNNSLPSLFERKHYLDRAAGTYVNANHFAGYLSMCTPLALSILFLARRPETGSGYGIIRRLKTFVSDRFAYRRAILPLSAAIVMSLAIIFSISRMGIFSFVLSFVLFAILIGKRHTLKRRLAVFGLSVVFILGTSIWLGLNPVLERFSFLDRDTIGRFEASKLTGQVIKDYPIFGTGLGTFTYVSPNYKSPVHKSGHWEASHNDFINIMSDTGVAGFMIAMGFLIAWYAYVIKRISGKKIRTYQRSIAAACIAGVSAILLHSIADFNLQIPANAFYFAILLGLTISVLNADEAFPSKAKQTAKSPDIPSGKPENTKNKSVLKKLFSVALPVVLIAILAPFSIRNAVAETVFENNRLAETPEEKMRILEESLLWSNKLPELHYQLGINFYLERKDYLKAKTYFAQAVNLTPTVGHYHYFLGMSYAHLGNDSVSEKELELAKRLSPMRPELLYKIGFFHFFKGRRTGSASYIEKAFAEFKTAAEINIGYLGKSLNLVLKYMPEYKDLMRIVPDTAGHHRGFAAFLASKGYWNEALIEYETAFETVGKGNPLCQSDENTRLGLAQCYLFSGNIGKAKVNYQKALELARNKRRLFAVIRTHFAQAKKLEDGLAFLEELKENFQGFEELDLEIAKCNIALGKLDEAEKLLLSISSIRPTQEVFHLLFQISMRRKDYDLAEIFAHKAIMHAPSVAMNYYFLAQVKSASRDYKTAVESLKRALSIDRGNKTFKKALEEANEKVVFEKEQKR